MAKPQPEVLASLQRAVIASRLGTTPGLTLFEPRNWHQSLSMPYFARPGLRDELLRVGARISATSFTMTINRIISHGTEKRGIHWTLRARGEPKGFRDLVFAVQTALRTEGLIEEHGHTPHLTISYSAPMRLQPLKIDPIEWVIDEVMLVEGRGEPYRYHTIKQWPLVPPPYTQLRLL